MILTDTHTHLYSDEFDTDREKLIELAVANGVSRFFLPNIDSSSIDAMLDLESRHGEICFPMMGWGMGVCFHALETFGYGKTWEEKKIHEILNKENTPNTKWK